MNLIFPWLKSYLIHFMISPYIFGTRVNILERGWQDPSHGRGISYTLFATSREFVHESTCVLKRVIPCQDG